MQAITSKITAWAHISLTNVTCWRSYKVHKIREAGENSDIGNYISYGSHFVYGQVQVGDLRAFRMDLNQKSLLREEFPNIHVQNVRVNDNQ